MDDMEPTPGAGPCIEDVMDVDMAEFRLLHEFLLLKEHDYVDILLESWEGVEVYVAGFAGLDCIRVISLNIRGCGGPALELLKAAADWPEVSRVAMEGDCIELTIPPEPPTRIKRALDKLGVEGQLAPKAFRLKGVA